MGNLVLYVSFINIHQIQVSPYFTMKLIFPIAVVLLAFVSCNEVSAHQCYSCFSSDQDWCKDGDALDDHKDDKPSSVKECRDGVNKCSMFKYEDDSGEVVYRSCALTNAGEDDCEEAEETIDGETVKGTLCICDSNLCNTAQRFGLNINLGVVITTFLVMKFLS